MHPDVFRGLNVLLPAPVGNERFVDESSNVAHLAAGGQRDLRVAVGLSDSALRIRIAKHNKDQGVEIGRTVALFDLNVMGAETASMMVGDTVLRQLIEQHADVFVRFSALSFQPQDQR